MTTQFKKFKNAVIFKSVICFFLVLELLEEYILLINQ